MVTSKIQAFLQTIVITSFCLFTGVNTASATDLMHIQTQSDKAPAQTQQFGQLVGKWKIEDWYLDKEGKWQPSSGADWHFYWILGGTAIQDDWISPALDKPAPKQGRQYGTNIRIFNPKLKKWQMAWASNSGAKVDTFEATAEKAGLVMTGLFNGSDSRITFYDISHQQFSWKLEQMDKTSKQFKEIYRIHGTRLKE